MKRKYSIGKFVIIAVLSAILLCLTVFSFALTGISSDSDFVGFARAINLGVEYVGGTVQEYSVNSNSSKNGNLQEGISGNVTRIKYLLSGSGYKTNVYQNSDNIVIELLDEYSPVEIQEQINKKVDFAIKTEQSDTAEAVVTAQDIQSAYATTSGSEKVLMMTFTKDGATNFAKVIEKGTAYFYFNSSYAFNLSVSNSNSQYLGITMTSLDTASNYASQIISAKYDLTFDQISTSTFTKADANRNTITLICLTVGLFVLCSAILIAMFKTLGLIGAFTLLIGVLLQIVLLQAIPTNVFTLTGPAMLASLLCMLLGALSIYLFYDKMHKEYKMGKILPASVKFGYKKIWATILDMYIILLVPSIITYFFGSYLVKQFAMALMAGLFVYMVTTIVLTLFFTKWFTYISFKNKDYGFKREAHINELK